MKKDQAQATARRGSIEKTKKVKGAQRTKVTLMERIAAIYGARSPISILSNSLADANQIHPPLLYASSRDMRCVSMIHTETRRGLADLAASGELAIMRLGYFPLPSAVSDGARTVDLAVARKHQSRLVRARSDCISMLVITAARDANEEHGFVLQSCCVTLAIERTNIPSQPRDATGGFQELLSVEQPGEVDVGRFADAFRCAGSLIQTRMDQVATASDPAAWRAAAQQRAVAKWQAMLLTPLKKVLTGNGIGKEIVARALTGPDAYVRSAKKVGDLTREEVVDLLWRAAATNALPTPTFVRI